MNDICVEDISGTYPYLGEMLIIDRSLIDLDFRFWIIHSMDFSSYEKL